jgi:hypothetical protein
MKVIKILSLGIGSSDTQWEPVLDPVWGSIFGPEP